MGIGLRGGRPVFPSSSWRPRRKGEARVPLTHARRGGEGRARGEELRRVAGPPTVGVGAGLGRGASPEAVGGADSSPPFAVGEGRA